MIRHIVLWTLGECAEGVPRAEGAAKMKALLDACRHHPHHVAMKPFVGAVRERRVCFDHETAGGPR